MSAPNALVKPAVFTSGFAGELLRSPAALPAAAQTPFATTASSEAPTAPAWKTIPSWAVISCQDKVIPPAGEKLMAARAHARVTEFNHLSLISPR